MPAAIRAPAVPTLPPAARFGGNVRLSPPSLVPRWYDRWLQRCALEELDDHLLRDIGLSPGDVRRELRKPFWR